MHSAAIRASVGERGLLVAEGVSRVLDDSPAAAGDRAMRVARNGIEPSGRSGCYHWIVERAISWQAGC
ncbi:hypothetical protein B1H26_18385 [Amycolatopsis sp. BJA-103]|nr:hypothetical protein BKN51_16120 [Amycolatopsis sp. BJA-103]PNE16956.1 hypothetical protein B1H26_18385 [Amycolatopsis sp. BJA-103]